ncbi:MAG: nucleotidyl transferase AbiEii/AbiGii toxin family protein [Bacteroidetes bacterium]|jgi:predicted nucleotidyltransferase component of viral defense system|nr:nucleotidyl transferase AbiEii/AbiGii toxin family protein [Bacteroidota bacterium]MBT6685335.1 nucleotidyl transferase AbiEii/AbiGii toxin family protein [Bacteroidota bacterium]
MVEISLIKKYFPQQIQNNSVFHKYMLKEYIQLLILDYLSASSYIKKLTFIGGTNLRLVKRIDRFSEDIDFDCKDLSKEEFIQMTDDVLSFLDQNGFRVESKDRKNEKLKAFRRNIYFPEFLFDLGLSAYSAERFLIKIESQDQLVNYKPIIANIKGCGFFFPFPVPPDEILCSMKISALLSRNKGRDFYDVMFLLALSNPDYNFLSKKSGVKNLLELKQSVEKMLYSINLKMKMKDFEHLLFSNNKSNLISRFGEFIREL